MVATQLPVFCTSRKCTTVLLTLATCFCALFLLRSHRLRSSVAAGSSSAASETDSERDKPELQLADLRPPNRLVQPHAHLDEKPVLQPDKPDLRPPNPSNRLVQPHAHLDEKPVLQPDKPHLRPPNRPHAHLDKKPVLQPDTPDLQPPYRIVRPHAHLDEEPVLQPDTPDLRPLNRLVQPHAHLDEKPVLQPDTPDLQPPNRLVRPHAHLDEEPVLQPDTPDLQPVLQPDTPDSQPVLQLDTPDLQPPNRLLQPNVHKDEPVFPRRHQATKPPTKVPSLLPPLNLPDQRPNKAKPTRFHEMSVPNHLPGLSPSPYARKPISGQLAGPKTVTPPNQRVVVQPTIAARPNDVPSPRKHVEIASESSLKGSRASKKFPQVIIIGVRKGGTRALINMLRTRPDVVAAKGEVHFLDQHFDEGVQWYIERMPLSIDGQLTVEKSPSYFVTEKAPKRLRSVASGDLKLLLIVRDPVERLISDFTQLDAKINGARKKRSFQSKVFLDNGSIDVDYRPVTVSMYDIHMERWLKYFKMDDIHVVDGDAFIKYPLPELKMVEEFLGVKPLFTDSMFYFNKTKGFYCWDRRLENDVDDDYCLGSGKGRTHPQVSTEIVQRLRSFYEPHNNRFYEMVHRNFAW